VAETVLEKLFAATIQTNSFTLEQENSIAYYAQ